MIRPLRFVLPKLVSSLRSKLRLEAENAVLRLLYAFVIVRLDRRDLVGINTTTNPTAEWVAGQITEAFPWREAPCYMAIYLGEPGRWSYISDAPDAFT